MVTCPRCGLRLLSPGRCPECGIALGAPGPGPFEVATNLLDPFEGRHLAELLESRRIPVHLRRRRRPGIHLHRGAPSWGELMVPAEDLDEARRLVSAIRAELAAGDALALAAGAGFPDVAPTRALLRAHTGGGPPMVSPFGRFGWFEVAGGRLGPGGHLEGRLSTGSRLVREVELSLVPDLPDPGPSLGHRTLPLPEETTVAFTLPIDQGPLPSVGYRLDARILGRRHVLATGHLHLRPRVPFATAVTGRA